MKDLNEISRREFIEKSSLGLLSIALLGNQAFSNEFFMSKKDDSGLFFSKNDIKTIKDNTENPVFKEYWKSLVNADLNADIKFLNSELDYNNHAYHLSRVNEILKRSAFVSLIEGNKEHEELAKLAIDKILAFNEWDYFTEGGKETIGLQRAPETTIAISWSVDLLDNALSDSKKAEMRNAVLKKGLPACYNTLNGMRYPDKVKGWGYLETTSYKGRVDLKRWPYFLNGTNLKAIPIAGLCAGTVAMGKKNPDYEKYLELAKYSISSFVKLYGKDGCYPEGIGYWSYATLYLILGIEALRRHVKYDFKNLINYDGTIKYAVGLQAPFKGNPGGVINFSDTGFNTDMTLCSWIAREFHNGLAQYAVENYSEKRSIFSLMWYDKKIKAEKPGPKMMDLKFDNGWVISRTGYSENDTVIGFRSGGPANHEHGDRNSIIVNAFGERLIHDQLGSAYFNAEKHWLLRLPEAHNGILIDGRGHQYLDGKEGTNSSLAVSKIVNYSVEKGNMICSSDATEAYKLINPDVKKVMRTVIFIKPDLMVLVDEVTKEKFASEICARFMAYNVDGKAIVTPDSKNQSFVISRPNARLYAKVFTTSGIMVDTGKLNVPEEKGIFPYAQVVTDNKPNHLLFTIFAFIPQENKEIPRIEYLSDKESVMLKIQMGKSLSLLKIKQSTNYPLINLLKS
jgi:hypothetical protein